MCPLNDQEVLEIKTAIEKGEALPAHLKPVIDLGLNIRTPKEEEAFKTNYHQTVIGPEISKLHTQYEQDIFAATGIKKNTNEKGYDYLKRAIPEKLTAMETELKDLKAKGTGNQSDVDKARIAQLEGMVGEKEKEITTLKTSTQQASINSTIEREIAKIEAKFKKDLSPTALKDLVDARRANLSKTAQINDAGIHFVDAQNQPIISKQTAKLLTVEEVVLETFKDILEEPVKGAGAGTQGGGAGGSGVKTLPKDMVLPEDIKFKIQVGDWLAKEGLTKDHKEYNETYARLTEKLPLRPKG